MISPWQSAAEAPFAFAWREGTGPVRLGWGDGNNSTAKSGFELRFQNFYGPTTTASENSWWASFPATGRLRFDREETLTQPGRRSLSFGAGQDIITRDEWRKYCEAIETALNSGHLKKLVPARARKFPPLPEADQRALLPTLMDRPAPGSFRFHLRYRDALFFGATPELLFRKSGPTLTVPAIAGTRPLAANGVDTEQAAASLLSDPKELAEHRFVVDGILAALSGLGLRPSAPSVPTVLTARNLVHLHTPVTCAHEGVDGAVLLKALHPTPAVGGFPRQPAAEFLKDHEPWHRGLFASPLHILDGGEELCLVAIRSALATPAAVYFFAGAGYVAGSDWDREWTETGHKMDSLKGLLEEP